jgi:hypothetical protein
MKYKVNNVDYEAPSRLHAVMAFLMEHPDDSDDYRITCRPRIIASLIAVCTSAFAVAASYIVTKLQP